MTHKKYYTYAYLRKDRTPYYIGKGQKKRMYLPHWRGRGNFTPKNKSRIIVLKYFDEEYEAFKHEKYMISVFGRKDLETGILINLTEGGDYPPSRKNKKSTDIHKKRISHSLKGKPKNYQVWNVGVSHNQKTKEKISKSKTGKRIDKIYTKERSEKITNSLCKSEYELLSPSGEKIITDNITKFSKENNLSASALYAVVNKKRPHHKGWVVFRI